MSNNGTFLPKEEYTLVQVSASRQYNSKGASYSNTEVRYFETKAEFLAQAEQFLKKGDTVLVKASHGMEFPEIVEKLKELTL